MIQPVIQPVRPRRQRRKPFNVVPSMTPTQVTMQALPALPLSAPIPSRASIAQLAQPLPLPDPTIQLPLPDSTIQLPKEISSSPLAEALKAGVLSGNYKPKSEGDVETEPKTPVATSPPPYTPYDEVITGIPARGPGQPPPHMPIKENYQQEGTVTEITPGLETALFPVSDSSWASLKPHGGERGNQFTEAHPASDLQTPEGTPLISPVNGRVVKIAYWHGGFGQYITIQDREGNLFVFAHLSAIDSDLIMGANVQRGQPIGATGGGKFSQYIPHPTLLTDTFFTQNGYLGPGDSSGPHLHFEIRNSQNEVIPPSLIWGGQQLARPDSDVVAGGSGATGPIPSPQRRTDIDLDFPSQLPSGYQASINNLLNNANYSPFKSPFNASFGLGPGGPRAYIHKLTTPTEPRPTVIRDPMPTKPGPIQEGYSPRPPREYIHKLTTPTKPRPTVIRDPIPKRLPLPGMPETPEGEARRREEEWLEEIERRKMWEEMMEELRRGSIDRPLLPGEAEARREHKSPAQEAAEYEEQQRRLEALADWVKEQEEAERRVGAAAPGLGEKERKAWDEHRRLLRFAEYLRRLKHALNVTVAAPGVLQYGRPGARPGEDDDALAIYRRAAATGEPISSKLRLEHPNLDAIQKEMHNRLVVRGDPMSPEEVYELSLLGEISGDPTTWGFISTRSGPGWENPGLYSVGIEDVFQAKAYAEMGQPIGRPGRLTVGRVTDPMYADFEEPDIWARLSESSGLGEVDQERAGNLLEMHELYGDPAVERALLKAAREHGFAGAKVPDITDGKHHSFVTFEYPGVFRNKVPANQPSWVTDKLATPVNLRRPTTAKGKPFMGIDWLGTLPSSDVDPLGSPGDLAWRLSEVAGEEIDPRKLKFPWEYEGSMAAEQREGTLRDHGFGGRGAAGPVKLPPQTLADLTKEQKRWLKPPGQSIGDIPRLGNQIKLHWPKKGKLPGTGYAPYTQLPIEQKTPTGFPSLTTVGLPGVSAYTHKSVKLPKRLPRPGMPETPEAEAQRREEEWLEEIERRKMWEEMMEELRRKSIEPWETFEQKQARERREQEGHKSPAQQAEEYEKQREWEEAERERRKQEEELRRKSIEPEEIALPRRETAEERERREQMEEYRRLAKFSEYLKRLRLFQQGIASAGSMDVQKAILPGEEEIEGGFKVVDNPREATPRGGIVRGLITRDGKLVHGGGRLSDAMHEEIYAYYQKHLRDAHDEKLREVREWREGLSESAIYDRTGSTPAELGYTFHELDLDRKFADELLEESEHEVVDLPREATPTWSSSFHPTTADELLEEPGYSPLSDWSPADPIQSVEDGLASSAMELAMQKDGLARVLIYSKAKDTPEPNVMVEIAPSREWDDNLDIPETERRLQEIFQTLSDYLGPQFWDSRIFLDIGPSLTTFFDPLNRPGSVEWEVGFDNGKDLTKYGGKIIAPTGEELTIRPLGVEQGGHLAPRWSADIRKYHGGLDYDDPRARWHGKGGASNTGIMLPPLIPNGVMRGYRTRRASQQATKTPPQRKKRALRSKSTAYSAPAFAAAGFSAAGSTPFFS